jgi:hypothetical protein
VMSAAMTARGVRFTPDSPPSRAAGLPSRRYHRFREGTATLDTQHWQEALTPLIRRGILYVIGQRVDNPARAAALGRKRREGLDRGR